MKRSLFVRAALIASVAPAWAAAPAMAQDYPGKPIQIIVPFGPGGSGDITARLFGKFLEEKWNQPVAIINRPGANGLIGTASVKTSPADGYTLGIASSSTHPAAPFLFKNVPYEWVTDFEHVGLFGVVGSVAVVRADGPIKDLLGFVEHAKANRDKTFYGYFNTTSQIPAELLKVRADVPVEGVAYKAIGNAFSDLLGGQIDLVFVDYVAASAHLSGGKVRALAITEPARRAAWPDVPALAEFYPGFDFKGYVSLMAPAGVPKDIVLKVNQALREALKTPEFRDRLQELGFTLRDYSVDDYKVFLQGEATAWAEYIRIAKLTPQ